MVNISVSDLTKVYGDSTPLIATVTDNGSPVSLVPVKFSINGVDYERDTNLEGVAMLNINLNIGTYDCIVSYGGVTCKVLVKITDKPLINLIVSNLTKTYGTDTQLVAKIDIPSIITGLPVQFEINGRTYDRLTDVNGEAHLNINLNPGVYPCTIIFPGNNTYRKTKKEITVTVKANTLIDGFNITKSYSDKGFYQCAVYDAWQRLNPCTVELTINGVKYTRTSNDEGLIRLNINLIPGEYPINVKFLGDDTHNPSSRADLVTVVPDIRTLGSYTREGAFVPENNKGELKSHVYVHQYDIDIPNQIVYHYGFFDTSELYDISYTTYEITETDPRVKTAKFTTSEYFDLTNGVCYVKIASPYHENFGGIILKVDYDKNTGLYTYQCQDGRRQYLSKGLTTSVGDVTIYDILESELISPAYYKSSKYTLPISQEQRNKHARLLSGLHPLDDYNDLKAGALKYDNKFKEKLQLITADSSINTIMNLSHNGGFPTDVYFDSNLICHIDPIDLDYWLSHGICLTHQDLVHYKYGFDTTNIITRVKAKHDNETYKSYDDFADLAFYFGGQAAMIDAATTTTTTEGDTSSASTNNVSTGIMSGKKTFAVGADNINGYSSDIGMVNKVIEALRAKGHNAYSLGVGPSVNQNHGLSSSSNGVIDIFIVGGVCAGTTKDFVDGITRGYYHYDHMIMMFANCTTDNWISCNALRTKKQIRAWDDSFSSGIDTSITPHEMFEKNSNCISYIAGQPNESFDSLVDKLVNGQFNCGGGGAASGTSETTTTTVPDETATYQKALDEMSKSIRSLLSFEVKVPLNSPVFKNLHTNSMLWTQLPPEFRLGNLEKIFKILPAYKVNRGVSYMENRWYVEKVSIKQDTNGLFATITLNPFPSDYSSYSNAVKQYAEAYDQKFNKKTETTTASSGGNRQPRLGNDSTDTNSMSAMSGGYRGNAGDNRNFDEAAKKGYAQQGRSYYEWARQYNSPIELAKALANRFSYSSYYNNRDANAEVTHNNGGTIRANCYDACRLVKCCFDAAGFDAVIIVGTIYEGGHGWNAVKHNGRWYSFDLCYAVTGTEWAGTNSLRLCDEW